MHNFTYSFVLYMFCFLGSVLHLLSRFSSIGLFLFYFIWFNMDGLYIKIYLYSSSKFVWASCEDLVCLYLFVCFQLSIFLMMDIFLIISLFCNIEINFTFIETYSMLSLDKEKREIFAKHFCHHRNSTLKS